MKLNKFDELWNSANLLLKRILGLLSSKNVATMTMWCNNFSSLLVTRINQMIADKKMLWSFVKLSQLVSKEIYKDQSGEFVCGY